MSIKRMLPDCFSAALQTSRKCGRQVLWSNQMIRDYRAADIDQILAIWLSASIKAHDFIESSFWKSKIRKMRDVYIPASETLVYEADGIDTLIG